MPADSSEGFWDRARRLPPGDDDPSFLDRFAGVVDDVVEGIVTAVSGERGPATMTKLEHLTQIVNEHERFWSSLAQHEPTDLLRTFIVSRWDPFFRAWMLERVKISEGGTAPESIEAFTRTAARALSELRELAGYSYIPTPDLGTAQHGVSAQPQVAGALTIQHGPGGQVVITHAPDVGAQPTVASGGHHGGHGGGGWGGGVRNFDMGWRGDAWGWPYPYGYAQPVAIQIPPGCFLDAYGQIVCPQPQPQPDPAGAPGTVSAGWFDDVTGAIGGAVKSAVNGVSHVASSAIGTVGHTLSQLKGPIATAAALAAGAAAAAIPVAGPLVAPMASGLAKSLVDAAAGSGDVQAAAQQVIAQAAQAATQDPHIAAAMTAATKAVQKATLGFHGVAQVARAAQGDAKAAAQLAELVQSAAAGDPQALATLNLTQGAVAASTSGPTGGAATVSGAAKSADPRSSARAAALEFPAKVVGVVLRSDGTWALEGFASSDAADDWYGGWLGMPHAFWYVAYFDKSDPTWPGAQNETFSRTYAEAHARGQATSVSGIVVPALAGLAGFAAGYFGPAGVKYARAKWDEHKAAHGAKAA